MIKLNKKQVLQAINSLRYCINDSNGAIGAQEKAGAKLRIQERARQLMKVLESDMNGHAKKLIPEGESMVDKATRRVLRIEEFITRTEAA